MKIDIKQEGNITNFVLTGRIDTNTSAELQSVLEEYYPREGFHIVMDFAGLDFVSSAGLRVLLLTEKKAKAAKGKMVIKNAVPEVMEVFEMTGLINILTIE